MFKTKNKLYYPRYLLGLFISIMLTFSVFRFITVILSQDLMYALPKFARPILTQSFFQGLVSDFYAGLLILFIPTLIMSFATLFSISEKFSYRVSSLSFLILFIPALIFHIADITFFNYFFERMNSTVFVWFTTPDIVIRMLLQEPSYFIALIVGVILVSIGVYINHRFTSFFISRQEAYPTLRKQLFFMVFFAMIFAWSAKSKSTMSPSNIELPFAKKLALNPALTMFDSLLRDYYRNDHSIDFGIKGQHPYELIPMAQSLDEEIKIPQKNHIVIVIMESMMAKNLSFHGGNPRTTPYLNKLRELSISFDHAYTAGIHTFNGIYSTIFSHPALFRDQPMQNMKNNQRANIAKSLQAINYTTNYFTTHVDYFDNAGPFLSSAGFQNIFSVKHYPPELAPSPMGVPDHIQFNFVIATMNHQHARGEKILSVIMTGSNHNPYVLPKDIEFEAPFKNLKHDVTAYADWSIGKFLDQAKKETWFNETLFVFVADHGLVKNPVFDMPLSYYHTPLLFFSHDIEPKSINQLASQMDIYPTVMGMLAQPFENTTQGINLLKNKRNYVFLNNDEKTALLSENEFFILYETGETLFYTDWKNKNVRDFKYEQPQAAQALKENLLENIRRILTN